jgi:hypothetical protein
MKSEPSEVETNRVRDARWHPVYAAVVIFTVLVIAALWCFSRAFSA